MNSEFEISLFTLYSFDCYNHCKTGLVTLLERSFLPFVDPLIICRYFVVKEFYKDFIDYKEMYNIMSMIISEMINNMSDNCSTSL